MEKRFLGLSRALLMTAIGLLSSQAFSVPATMTYQGRIVKSDGSPLQHNNVSFTFSITDPGGLCVIYREEVNGLDMSNSKGVFDVQVGAGTRLFPTGSSPFTVIDSLSNVAPLPCQGGTTYTPAADDGRRLRVQFYDGVGWKLISPDNIIRSVPYAGYAASAVSANTAKKLDDKVLSDFVLKSLVPTCTANTFLSWDGTTFTCEAVTGVAGGTVTNVTGSGPISVATGTTTPTISISQANASTDGYLTQADWNAFNSKISAITNSATLTNANIWIGDGTNKAQQHPVSGDATLSNTGALTIGAGAVSLGKVAADAVDSSKIVDSSIGVADLNFVGVMAANTGLVVRNGTQFHNKACTLGQILSWTANGWDCAAISSNETDPKVGANTLNYLSKWDGTQLVSSGVLENAGSIRLTPRTAPGAPMAGDIFFDSSNGNKFRIYDTSWKTISFNEMGWHPSVYAPSGAGPDGQPDVFFNPMYNAAAIDGAASLLRIGAINTAGVYQNAYIGSVSNTAGFTPSIVLGQRLDANNYSERMRIDQNGNVGIGTTNPQAKLDVNGIIRATEICDEAGGNCKDISTGWGGGASGTVTNVTGSGPISVATGTTTPAISISQATTSTNGYVSSTDWNTFNDKLGTAAAFTGDVTGTYNATAIANDAVTTAKVLDGTITGLDLNFTGLNTATTGFVMKDNTGKFFNFACATTGHVPTWTVTGFACQAVSANEVDPQVGANTLNYLSKWDGSALVASTVYENAGNVGIGTATPQAKLDVSGIIRATDICDEAGLNCKDISAGWGADGDFMKDGSVVMTGALKAATGSAAAPGYSFSGDLTTGIYRPSANNIGISTNSTERIRIDSLGRVGIGTSSPGYPLTVRSASGEGIAFENSSAGNKQWRIMGDGDDFVVAESGIGYQFVIKPGGKVGLGTSAPDTNLEVRGGGDTSFKVVKSGAVGITTTVKTGQIEHEVAGGGGEPILWKLDGTERVRFAANGNVGIGTATPANKLSVAGVIESTTGGVRFPDGSIQTTATGGGSGGTMMSGWPDGIRCINGGTTFHLILANGPWSDGRYYYENNSMWIGYNSNGSYFDSGSMSGYDCVVSAYTISTLYSMGRAFNFVGGGSNLWTASGANTYFGGGNVGIGTVTPGSALDVNGNINMASSTETAASSASSAAAYTIPDLTKNIRRIDLTANTTLTLPVISGLAADATYTLTIRVKQDATGSRTLAWAGNGNTIKWDSGVAVVPASGANQITVYQFFIIGGETTWYGSMVWREN